jgi:pilus assembly protein FimV
MRRPSAALVVATAALVMSTIGTSFAARQYVISSPSQIKPGSISLKALNKAARKALRGARGPAGAVGAAGAPGAPGAPGAAGTPGAPATKLWAQISADGRVNAASGPVTARAGVAPGTYAVNFGQDITHCAAMATQGGIPSFSAPGAVAAGVAGAPLVRVYSAGIDLAPGFPSISTVIIATTNEAAAGAPVATTFFVAVFC